MELDFSLIIGKLSLKNSYDYEFNYGWNEDYNGEQGLVEKDFKPTKVNEIAMDNSEIMNRFPVLHATIRPRQ